MANKQCVLRPPRRASRVLAHVVYVLGLSFGIAHSADVPPDFSALDVQIQCWVEGGYYEGASLIIGRGAEVIHEKSFGRNSEDTVVFIASAGKWLSAATIATVVDEGKLSWDDTAAKWLPELKSANGRATLRQLLSHTGGYLDYQFADRRFDSSQTLAESLPFILTFPKSAEPGTRFEYSGLAMQVAGRMAELATGRNWDELFQQRIARPLGMMSTRFTPVENDIGYAPMVGGSARSCARDYAKFLAMLANDGVFEGRRVLSSAAIREMESDQVRGARVEPGREFVEKVRSAKHNGIYGLGCWREELDARGQAALLSSPGWAGTYPWIDKSTGVWGVMVAHVNRAAADRDKFSGFYSSPRLALLAREAMQLPQKQSANHDNDNRDR
ncbi:MAG: serine hydrolase domain-containing protein [Planctomycetaceae bacterium]